MFLMQRALISLSSTTINPLADWLSLLQKWRLTGQIIPRSFGHLISVVAADCCTCLTHPAAVLELCLQAWSQNSAQQPRLVCKCGRSTDYMVVNKMRNQTRVAGQLLSFAGCLLGTPTSAAAVIRSLILPPLCSSRVSLVLYYSYSICILHAVSHWRPLSCEKRHAPLVNPITHQQMAATRVSYPVLTPNLQTTGMQHCTAPC
ncbi:hypothetical protein V8C40DRAFT_76189 [Trichoderma camerunense]